MEAGKYKELEEYLQQLDEEMKGKEKNNRDVFVNDILEKALQGQDEKAVDILLQFVRMISPVSYISQKLITDDPILFRKLAKSRKLDWSPYHVMEVKLSKRIYEKRSFTGNLMEILIVLHKADLVQILLEEGYSYRSYERTKRDRSLDNGKEYSDFFMENTMKSNVCENLLELAISVCDIEITKIFMEQGKYDFSTEKYKMEKRKNKQEAFFVWMMEEYPERLIEKLKLEWMLRQCGPYQYKDKVFAFYVEKKGLEVLLEELKESLSAVIKNQVVFGSDQSVFFVLNVIETISKQKKMAKTTEDKEKINKTEQECFTMLRNAKNLNQYPMWFFITADYWYRKEKMLAKDMAEILFFIYFYWHYYVC